MKVKALHSELTQEQRDYMGCKPYDKESYDITIGKEYVVLGYFMPIGLKGLKFDIIDDDGELSSVPRCLFEITDGKQSKHWRAFYLGDYGKNQSLIIQHFEFSKNPDLLEQYYCYEHEAVKLVEKIIDQLHEEAES
ncbi:MAG: hypothetical protein FJX23_10445 [Alphaproteobacteria bacterium]|nr:hypothetical protein [Alphaproteobacteria bacterium]